MTAAGCQSVFGLAGIGGPGTRIDMKFGYFEVSEELIRTSLALPDDMRIVNIERASTPGVFVFHVEHPALPDIAEGADSQFVDLTFEADYTKKPATWITTRLRVDSRPVR